MTKAVLIKNRAETKIFSCKILYFVDRASRYTRISCKTQC